MDTQKYINSGSTQLKNYMIRAGIFPVINETKECEYNFIEYDEDGEENIYSINKIDVEEGHKLGGYSEDPNITELYIEKEICISIHKLVLKT